MNVFVRDDGCIGLGRGVICDGFHPEADIRIQTHAHHDHLKDFERSKGQQRILLSKPTLDLLISEFNADLPYRTNIQMLPIDGSTHDIDGRKISFFPSGHLIGSVISVVEDESGVSAYTGDFSWPLTNLPANVDTLIVDATYGDPKYIRNYSQSEVIERLLDVIRDELNYGVVVFTGHRGRLQYVAQLLSDHFEEPMIFSTNAVKTLDVFMKHRGFSCEYFHFQEADAHRMIRDSEKCFVFMEHRDRVEIDQIEVDRKVLLSPFMVPKQEPVAIYSKVIRVALTDHADFTETIELIKAVSPKRLIADNSRGGNADSLAEYVTHELRIEATSVTVGKKFSWGYG